MQSITAKDVRNMQWAESYITESTHYRYNLAALVIKSGRILNYGVNRPSAKPYYIQGNLWETGLHAETNCLRFLDRRATSNAVMVIAGRTKANHLMKTKPCPSCLIHIKDMGIKKVYFHDEFGTIQYIKVKSCQKK